MFNKAIIVASLQSVAGRGEREEEGGGERRREGEREREGGGGKGEGGEREREIDGGREGAA